MLMAFQTQRHANGRIEQASLIARAIHKLFPERFEWNGGVMGVKVYSFTLTAVCAAMLAGKIISQEYSVSPSDVWLGLTQYLLFFGYAALPAMSVCAGTTPGAFCLSNQEFSGSHVMERKEFRDADAFRMHVRPDDNRSTTFTLAWVFTLIVGYPSIHAFVIGAAMIASVWTVLDMPYHVTHCIKFNVDLQANGMNCWKPDRRANFTSRAISSQAGSTLPEGSETTGAVQPA